MNILLSSSGSIHIIQGDCVVSDDPKVVMTTVLGSCVSACLFDTSRGIGGMNHFLLPEAGASPGDNRYAAAAMERLLNKLLQKGASRSLLKAKLFGGARILEGLSDVGSRNAHAAKTFLIEEGITLLKSDLCGNQARRIRFWPTTGRVLMELVAPTVITRIEVISKTGAGQIEFF